MGKKNEAVRQIPSRIWIDGAYQDSSSSRSRVILNPSNQQELAQVPECNEQDLDRAIRSARSAQRGWWKMTGLEKAVLLREAGRKIRTKDRELAELLTLETGKPLIESYDCVDWVAACFEYYSEVARSSYGNSVPPVAPHQVNFTIKEPFGVVAAIAPFNFPLLLMAWKVAPALAAGNTVVCKPPHQNPLSNLLLASCLDHLPPGVVQVLTGGPELGEALVRHPEVDLIAFTGSTEVGRKVAAIAGEHLKKVNLELGGIDPLIVFGDADLDVAVRGTAWARLLNAGQVCTSSKRIYLEESIAEEFTRRLLDYLPQIKMGDPMDPTTDLGPLISAEARAKVQEQVKRALAEGAKLAAGGSPAQPKGLTGFYFEPTVLVNVKHGSLPTREEIFGPVISLITVKDREEAIRFANDSRFGLGATIFTRSLETAFLAMENIKAGTFWINDPLTDNDAAPFGGMRHSGIGRELGQEGLDAFREPKHVHLDYKMERKTFWFPYSDRPIPVHSHSGTSDHQKKGGPS
jgi:acyl-CoA reductase-like NAD-dependent aldehyde dehydrogenase